jgi:hypothetical protein
MTAEFSHSGNSQCARRWLVSQNEFVVVTFYFQRIYRLNLAPAPPVEDGG